MSLVSLNFLGCIFSTEPEKPAEKINLEQIWVYDHSESGDATPLLSNDTLFASADQYVFALEANTGKLIWREENDINLVLQGNKFLKSGNQIVAHHVKSTKAWNATTGILEWEYENDPESRNEARRTGKDEITDKGYTIASLFSRFYTLNNNGIVVQTRDFDPSFGVSGVCHWKDEIIVTQFNSVNGALTLGRLTAINTNSGDSLWSYNTRYGGFSRAKPIVEDGVLYAGTVGNSETRLFLAFELEQQTPKWEFTTQNPLGYTEDFILGPDLIYIRSAAYLFVLDKQTGEKVWDFKWTSATSVNPVYLGGYVYVSDHYTIYILDAETGELAHTEPLPEGGGYFWHLTVSEDKLFAQTSYQLIAYEPWHLRKN